MEYRKYMEQSANSEMQLRRATLNDVARVVDLVNSAYRGDSSRRGWTTEADLLGGQRLDSEMVQSILSQPEERLWVSDRSDGRLVAVAHLKRLPGEVGLLGMLTVRPDQQGRGLGRSLLASAEREARALGIRELRMMVIKQRLELISWYERRGYRRTGESEPFPYGDERFGLPLRSDLAFVVLSKIL